MQRTVLLPIIICDYICDCMFPLLEIICCMHVPGWEKEHACSGSCGRCVSLSMWDALFWGILIIWICLKVCVRACMHFWERVHYVGLHELCVCIIVFSARLAVPVCACVTVAHDPGSAGRSMSFMSPVQYSLKSGSKDKRITPICYDAHTPTHTDSHRSLWKMTSWRFEW